MPPRGAPEGSRARRGSSPSGRRCESPAPALRPSRACRSGGRRLAGWPLAWGRSSRVRAFESASDLQGRERARRREGCASAEWPVRGPRRGVRPPGVNPTRAAVTPDSWRWHRRGLACAHRQFPSGSGQTRARHPYRPHTIGRALGNAAAWLTPVTAIHCCRSPEAAHRIVATQSALHPAGSWAFWTDVHTAGTWDVDLASGRPEVAGACLDKLDLASGRPGRRPRLRPTARDAPAWLAGYRPGSTRAGLPRTGTRLSALAERAAVAGGRQPTLAWTV